MNETDSNMQLQDNEEEKLPVVDMEGHVIGSASRGECHNGSMLLHPVVHLHVTDSAGRLCLQLRPSWKKVQPGKWDTAVGGHVDYGETIDAALLREAHEEIGINIDVFKPMAVSPYVFHSRIERELVYPFIVCLPEGIELYPSAEVEAIRFWTLTELAETMNTGKFTPNFENEYLNLIEPALRPLR